VSIFWDKTGQRYGRGAGLHIVANDQTIAQSDQLEPLSATLPAANSAAIGSPAPPVYNFAVNNDGRYFPRVNVSYTGPKSSSQKLIDGNYWYHRDPPNRWTAEGTTSNSDWIEIDFGIQRKIHEVALYFLDDGDASPIGPPERVTLEYWDENQWASIQEIESQPGRPMGRRANRIRFRPLETSKIRVALIHDAPHRRVSGLSELEAWGTSASPIPHPEEPSSLGTNRAGKGFPKATASFTSRYDKVEMANDGITNFNAAPHNRWTAYESPNDSDWLAIDFGEQKQVGRVELAIYDDRGGVRAPADYHVEYFDGKEWRRAKELQKSPAQPTGGQFNSARFEPVNTSQIRVVFTHDGKSRSGISEILIWPQ
jgi:hypothetical protein